MYHLWGQKKGLKRAGRTYLRANGKLRQALVDTFRGLSSGLLAAEKGMTTLLTVRFTTVIIKSWKENADNHINVLTSGNFPKRMTSCLRRDPHSLQNPVALTSTSKSSSMSLWYYFSKHYSTYLQIKLESGGGHGKVWRIWAHKGSWFVYMQVVECQLGHKRTTQLEPDCTLWLDNIHTLLTWGALQWNSFHRAQLLHGIKGLSSSAQESRGSEMTFFNFKTPKLPKHLKLINVWSRCFAYDAKSYWTPYRHTHTLYV